MALGSIQSGFPFIIASILGLPGQKCRVDWALPGSNTKVVDLVLTLVLTDFESSDSSTVLCERTQQPRVQYIGVVCGEAYSLVLLKHMFVWSIQISLHILAVVNEWIRDFPLQLGLFPLTLIAQIVTSSPLVMRLYSYNAYIIHTISMLMCWHRALIHLSSLIHSFSPSVLFCQ